MTTHRLEGELYEKVKRDNEIFDFLQEGSLDGTWYLDLETNEEWLSPRFWTTLGYDPATKKHAISEWQSIIHPDDLVSMMEEFNKHLADPNYPFKSVVRYTHLDGHTVWISCRGIAIRDETGKPLRVLGAHTDVTETKEAQRKISVLEDEVSELKAFVAEMKGKIRIRETE